jgi:hypothetical protein
MNVWDLLLLIWLGIVPALVVAALLLNLVANNVVQTHARAHGPIHAFPARKR